MVVPVTVVVPVAATVVAAPRLTVRVLVVDVAVGLIIRFPFTVRAVELNVYVRLVVARVGSRVRLLNVLDSALLLLMVEVESATNSTVPVLSVKEPLEILNALEPPVKVKVLDPLALRTIVDPTSTV